MKTHHVLIIMLMLLVGCSQSQAQYNKELEQTIYSLVEEILLELSSKLE